MVCEEYYSETKLKSNILNINTTDGVVLKKLKERDENKPNYKIYQR